MTDKDCFYELMKLMARLEDLSEERRALADRLWLIEDESTKTRREVLALVNRIHPRGEK